MKFGFLSTRKVGGTAAPEATISAADFTTAISRRLRVQGDAERKLRALTDLMVTGPAQLSTAEVLESFLPSSDADFNAKRDQLQRNLEGSWDRALRGWQAKYKTPLQTAAKILNEIDNGRLLRDDEIDNIESAADDMLREAAESLSQELPRRQVDIRIAS